jgi:hypothetical protein
MYSVCHNCLLFPSTQQTIGYNWVYNEMFRLTRVIVRVRSERLILTRYSQETVGNSATGVPGNTQVEIQRY